MNPFLFRLTTSSLSHTNICTDHRLTASAFVRLDANTTCRHEHQTDKDDNNKISQPKCHLGYFFVSYYPPVLPGMSSLALLVAFRPPGRDYVPIRTTFEPSVQASSGDNYLLLQKILHKLGNLVNDALYLWIQITRLFVASELYQAPKRNSARTEEQSCK